MSFRVALNVQQPYLFLNDEIFTLLSLIEAFISPA